MRKIRFKEFSGGKTMKIILSFSGLPKRKNLPLVAKQGPVILYMMIIFCYILFQNFMSDISYYSKEVYSEIFQRNFSHCLSFFIATEAILNDVLASDESHILLETFSSLTFNET